MQNSDKKFPDQWKRLTQAGRERDVVWGEPILPNSALAGKTAEELASWAANCKAKISFNLGKIPDSTEENDGFWEVRVCWYIKRSEWLTAARIRLLEMNSSSPSEESEGHGQGWMGQKPPAIRPLLPKTSAERLGGWPGAQPVSYTKRFAENPNPVFIHGDGLAGSTESTAISPSPTALLADALQPPLSPTSEKRKEPEKEKEKEEEPRRSKRLKKPWPLTCDEHIDWEELGRQREAALGLNQPSGLNWRKRNED